MKMKVESEKVGLKLNIQKMKIMASGPTTSWEIDGETVETVSDFIFLGSKITTDGDCSHEIKRRLLLRRKVMTNLDSIFKSRDITLPTKVHLVKAMVFPVVMYGCESWTLKKAAAKSLQSCPTLCDPIDGRPPGSASLGFSRQEHWSGLNMLSRLVITFLPRSKHLFILWLQSPSAVILEPRKIKSGTVSTVSPSISHEVVGPDAMLFVF